MKKFIAKLYLTTLAALLTAAVLVFIPEVAGFFAALAALIVVIVITSMALDTLFPSPWPSRRHRGSLANSRRRN